VTHDLDSKTARQLCEYFETEEYKIHPPTFGLRGDQEALLCELVVSKKAATWLMIRAEAAKARAKPMAVLQSDTYRGFDDNFTSDGLTWMQADSEAMEREMMGRAEKLIAGDSSAQLERSMADSCTGLVSTDHKPIGGPRRRDSFLSEDEDQHAQTIRGTSQYGDSTLTAECSR
jgi:hypothetical protein